MTEQPPSEQTPLIIPELVALDAAVGPHKRDVIKFLARKIGDSGRADDANGLAGDALAREATAPTGIPGGIAIPHCRSSHVLTASLGFARLAEPVDFGADDDQAADIVFMIAAPDGADDVHLQLLAKLARGLMNDAFTDALRAAASAEEVTRIVTGQVQPELLEAATEQVAGSPAAGSPA
ncbi:MAG: PTS sugar transporter subunit IIA, partial [Peptidiphaga sp.]